MKVLENINIDFLKSEYEKFKKTDIYNDRKKQIDFVILAEKLTIEIFNQNDIKQENINSLIQVFKNNCSNEIFEKYIKSIDISESKKNEFIDTFKNIEKKYRGFTDIGKIKITKNLTSYELKEIQKMVNYIKNSNNIEEIKSYIKEFESKNIPEVKEGIYSPWLYYIKPNYCPIINSRIKPFIKELNYKSYSDTIDIFNYLSQILNESNLGFIDSFIYYIKEEDIKKYYHCYWIFQCNPSVWDINNFKIDTKQKWEVNSHKDKIKKNDKVIIWQKGKNSGVYTLAKIISEIEENSVNIEMEYDLIDNPILRNYIKNNKIFETFKAGNQGTNFKATKEEYDELVKIYTNLKNGLDILTNIDLDKFIIDFIEFSNKQEEGEPTVYVKEFNKLYNNKIYKNLEVNYSVGQGKALEDPWISFLGYFQKTTQGIYPVINYSKIDNKLYILYGISTQNESEKHWHDNKNWECFKSFEVDKIINGSMSIKEDLDKIIDEYHKLFRKETKNTMKKIPLNQILYGPPGTGKTYNTINKAIEIINPSFNLKQSREIVKKEYDKLVTEGRIVFTTFHQSMSYEDFVEGIKPQKVEEKDSFLNYEIESGIFKSICDNAKIITVLNKNIDWNVNYYKMSVGGKNESDIHNWCLENSVISLGWGPKSDLSEVKNIKNLNEYRNKFKELFPELVKESTFHIQSTYSFINMKENDIVVISKGNKIIDAIGLVKGQYYWSDTEPIRYVHYRKVEWIAKEMSTSPERFLKNNISQQSIYQISKENIKKEAFEELTNFSDNSTKKPFVLIIDEINRGNVSQIFGELITLIEEDKRQGKEEAIEVKLPYSKKPFSVPDNVYIIGTMNTADRSIESLDTALRRRFYFEEILPKYDLKELDFEIKIENESKKFKIKEILQTINKRIEKLLDRDHLIGHSFFLNIQNIEDLKNSFYKNIIPLLQEYFFGDYGKIGLILGKGFITKEKNEDVFSNFEYEEKENLIEKQIYKIIHHTENSSFESAIAEMMKNK